MGALSTKSDNTENVEHVLQRNDPRYNIRVTVDDDNGNQYPLLLMWSFYVAVLRRCVSDIPQHLRGACNKSQSCCKSENHVLGAPYIMAISAYI